MKLLNIFFSVPALMLSVAPSTKSFFTLHHFHRSLSLVSDFLLLKSFLKLMNNSHFRRFCWRLISRNRFKEETFNSQYFDKLMLETFLRFFHSFSFFFLIFSSLFLDFLCEIFLKVSRYYVFSFDRLNK